MKRITLGRFGGNDVDAQLSDCLCLTYKEWCSNQLGKRVMIIASVAFYQHYKFGKYTGETKQALGRHTPTNIDTKHMSQKLFHYINYILHVSVTDYLGTRYIQNYTSTSNN